jgi:hypothetical protein
VSSMRRRNLLMSRGASSKPPLMKISKRVGTAVWERRTRCMSDRAVAEFTEAIGVLVWTLREEMAERENNVLVLYFLGCLGWSKRGSLSAACAYLLRRRCEADHMDFKSN